MQLVYFKHRSTCTYSYKKPNANRLSPMILLTLSARGSDFLIFNYLRHHYNEIRSRFMEIWWNSYPSAFFSNDYNKNFAVYFETKRISSKNEKYSCIGKKMHLSLAKYELQQYSYENITEKKIPVAYKYFERELTLNNLIPPKDRFILLNGCLLVQLLL